jgi:hypothetical protein
MLIQVLGAGCAKCSQLAENADRAAKESNVDYVLEKVTDIARIISFDVMTTPAMLIDGKCYCSGIVPTVEEIKAMIRKAGES